MSYKLTANLPNQYHQTVLGGNGCRGLSRKTNAKVSAEANVVEEEATGINENLDYGVVSVHHVGVLCENLERSLEFYQRILGMVPFPAKLTNPDLLSGRPEHGGRDQHTCIAIRDVSKLKTILDESESGIPNTLSQFGRPAVFTRDPDANALEFTQVDD